MVGDRHDHLGIATTTSKTIQIKSYHSIFWCHPTHKENGGQSHPDKYKLPGLNV